MIIVIDGPAGSGKSSTAKAVADKLELQYIDSGAIYRVVTLLYIQSDFNQNKFFELFRTADIAFHYEKNVFHVFLNGEEVSEAIRTRDVTSHVSEVAAMPEVRSEVTAYLRKCVKNGKYIADGRDLGTVVYPDAELKIFMNASLEERAMRRYQELLAKNMNTDLDVVKSSLQKRDSIDSGRDVAPLKKADDAIVVDTSKMSFDEQVDLIISYIQDIKSEKMSNKNI